MKTLDELVLTVNTKHPTISENWYGFETDYIVIWQVDKEAIEDYKQGYKLSYECRVTSLYLGEGRRQEHKNFIRSMLRRHV